MTLLFLFFFNNRPKTKVRSTESLGRLLKNGPFRLFYNQGCPAVKKKYHNQYKIQRRYSTLNPHNVTFTKN